jgi:hypothetical protein
MAYGTVKVDNITFTNGGSDQTITVSGIVSSISGNITATGTIQAATIIGTTLVSGATVTGNVAQFTNITGIGGSFTTLTGATVTGTTANFVTVSGFTVTGASGSFGTRLTAPTVVGTTLVSGATVTGTIGQFTTLAAATASVTTLTGNTVTGVNANFSSGVFTSSISGASATFTSGIFALGSASAPSITYAGDLDTGLYSPGANEVAIATSGTGRLFIDSSGRVGIGTSSPGAILDVKANTSGEQRSIRVGPQSSETVGEIYCTESGGYNRDIAIGGQNVNFYTGSSGATTRSEVARIDSSGRVGIGTASPGSLLDLRSVSAPSLHISTTGYTPDYRGYSIDLSEAQQTGGINFTKSSPSAFLDLYAGGSASALGGWNGQIRFFTGGTDAYGTERARIDSSGRLLVGTSASRYVGHTQDAVVQTFSTVPSQAAFTFGFNNTAGTILALAKTRSSTISSRLIVANGDTLGDIRFVGDDGVDLESIGGSIRCDVDGTPGSNDMPGRLVFSTTADGASSPTERLRITSDAYVRLASGTGGIQFNGDTAAANALDDYEEGTFTPTITQGVTSPTYNTGNTRGTYRIIGKQLLFSLRVQLTGGTTDGVEYLWIAPGKFQTGASLTDVHAVGSNSLTTMTVWDCSDRSAVTGTEATNTLDLMITGAYPI